MLSRRSLPLLLALLLAACGQPQSTVSLPPTTPATQPAPVKPAPVLGGVYEIHFQNIGGNQPSSAARLIGPRVSTQALTDLPDAAISLQPVGLDTFVVGGVRHVRAVYRITNNTAQPIEHLSFVPINTDDADSDPTNNTSTPTVGATYFSRLLTFGGTDASGRATALTPTSGKIFSAAQGAALPDPEATPYTALDTSPLNPAAPAGLVVASRSSNAWRSAAALAPGASTNVTFAVDLTTDTPQTDPFSFSVVLTVADDVNTAPSLAPATSSTPRLSLPASSPVTSPAAYVSGVLGDSTDPASSTGLDFTVADSDTVADSLSLTATSSDSGIATVAVSGTGATRTVKITPQSVGKADITVTVSDGTLSSSYVVKYASSKASSTPGTTLYHTGESNASSAIAVDSDYMFVADDEYNALRLYPRNASGLAVSSFDFSAQLALPDAANPELDLEASTRSGNRLYWLASHSNSKNGKLRPNRYRLFATDLSGSGAGSTLSYVGRFDNLRSDLLTWDSSNGHGLGANYLGFNASAALDVAPEAAGGVGFNIEGLSFAPGSTTTAYLAFRAPNLPTTSRTKALIVPVTNFDALVTGAAQANFGAPIFLDLGGRGIRELKCGASSCLILAGPATGGSNFALYTWSGNAGDAPQFRNDLTALATDSDGSLESIVDLPALDLTTSAADGAALRLLSDNGDTVYYGDGVGAKDLITPDAQKNWQKFRSDTVALGSAQTCTVNSVTVSPSAPSSTVGVSTTFTAAVTTTPANCPVVVTWSSGDTSKATIQPTTGVATGVAAGSTTITATVQGYGSAPMTGNALLTVNAAPDYTLTLGTPTPASFTAGTAGTATATLTVNPSNGYSGTPSYTVSSSPAGITGSVTGSTVNLSVPGSLGAGTYTVTVTGTDGALVHTSNAVTLTVSAGSLPNVVVYRVGDGSAALTSAATPVFLDTFSGTSGTMVGTLGLPTAVSGSNHRLTASGSATSEGLLSRSVDGKYIVLTGYDAAPGTASIAGTTSATVNRVIGRVNAGGTVDTSTALSDAASGNNVRSAASADGNSFYIAGGAGGVRSVAALGATTSTQLSTTTVNLRQINIFGGQLYASSSSGSTRLATVGTNTPTTAGQTISNLPGISSTTSTSPYSFFFADLDGTPGIDTLYVADDTSTVGIQKYSLNAGTWTLKNAVQNGSDTIRGLTGYVNGSTVTLFATTPAKLLSITDSSGYNANLAGSFTTLATAATNTAFRGVALAPTP